MSTPIVSQTRVFVLVDFQAQNQFTHHGHYIEAFARYLVKGKRKFKILLPANSYLSKSWVADHSEFFLRSPIFGDSLHESKKWFVINFLLRRVHEISSLVSKSVAIKVGRLIRLFYIRTPLRQLSKELSNSSDLEVSLLAPTCDPLILELVEKLSKYDNFSAILRMVGGEARGFIADELWDKRCTGLQEKMGERLKVCYEVKPYGDYLISRGLREKHVHWLPVPPLSFQKFSSFELGSKPIRLGFLGMAKKRKGFEETSSILRHLSEDFKKMVAVCQETLFPWEGYSREKMKLDSMQGVSLQIEFREANLSFERLKQEVSQCHYLVMPYDESYSKNGSAMFYLAADAGVSVICPRHVGFAPEVEFFGLGISYETVQEIPNLMATDQMDDVRNGFKHYEFARLSQVSLVLG